MPVTVVKTKDANSRNFNIGQKISGREKTYCDSTEALQSPIASKIFGFPWTASVRVGGDFVEITKQDWVEWEILEEPLLGLLTEHFSTAGDGIEENPEFKAPQATNLDSPEGQSIQKLIEDQVNPALAAHGGFVVLHGLDNNKVYLEMGGGCQGCAMSYQTMKDGIEGAIKEVVPTITEVIDVTNHAAGDNPFYTEEI